MDDSYFVIQAESRAEIKVKNSRFIGETFLTENLTEVSARLEAVRKREHAASHHCYAWQIGTLGEKSFKYSDDGEPSGTAGKPMYDVLLGSGVTNALLVVTRYFGGTKLGTGGLTRAYSDAAQQVMQVSGRVEKFITVQFALRMEFHHYDKWLKLQQKLGASVLKTDFSDDVSAHVSIRKSRAEELLAVFTELTAGKGHIEKF